MAYLHTKLIRSKTLPITGSPLLLLLLVVGVLIINQCRVAPLQLESLPSSIKTLEGYASLVIKSDGRISRGKASFFLAPPGEARLDISDTLGRTVSQLLFLKSIAYFILPREKVYWEGPEEELFVHLFGFSLSIPEWNSLLFNQESLVDDWVVEKDASGRIWRGQKNEVAFVIKRYAGRTRLVESLVIFYPGGEVHWRLREVYFNRPPRAGIFSLRFKERFQQKPWMEIEEYLR